MTRMMVMQQQSSPQGILIKLKEAQFNPRTVRDRSHLILTYGHTQTYTHTYMYSS